MTSTNTSAMMIAVSKAIDNTAFFINAPLVKPLLSNSAAAKTPFWFNSRYSLVMRLNRGQYLAARLKSMTQPKALIIPLIRMPVTLLI